MWLCLGIRWHSLLKYKFRIICVHFFDIELISSLLSVSSLVWRIYDLYIPWKQISGDFIFQFHEKLHYSSQLQLKLDINYTDYHRFSWDVCTIFKTFPNRSSIFLHKGKKLDENEDTLLGKRGKGWYKNNRTDEKTTINLNFRCLENYNVNLFGKGIFRGAVLHSFTSCTAQTALSVRLTGCVIQED